MKKVLTAMMILLTLSATTHPIYSLPYWFQEGTYVKYAVKMPENPDKREVNVFPVWPLLLSKNAYVKIKDVSPPS
jgi:hypothetical protein